jgi:glucosamine--fructose-6-phosphate aminotransferase (isomerizing)
MTEAIEAEQALAERLIRRLATSDGARQVADAVRAAASAGEPIELFGCGTSEHAAEGVAAIWTEALGLPPGRDVRHRPSLEVAGAPLAEGVAVAISHEGGTDLTNRGLRASRAAGARTALVTVSDRSPGAALADLAITTEEQDPSWCHTVGYLSPLLAGTAIGAIAQGRDPAPHALASLLAVTPAVDAAESIARALADRQFIIVAGSAADHPTARELALKIAEGARVPALALDVETVLHGHLAAAGASTGIVVIVTDPGDRAAATHERAVKLLGAAAALGMPAAAIFAAELDWDVDDALTPAGRLLVRQTQHVPAAVRSILGAAIPLQLAAERLARARGVNPDTLGRDDPRQAAAHA